jgi:GntR family transcriptional regulator, transcriptional repressor for pyruvate dehydrogenase complex
MPFMIGDTGVGCLRTPSTKPSAAIDPHAPNVLSLEHNGATVATARRHRFVGDSKIPLTMDDASSKPLVATLMAFVAERRLQPGDRLPSERELAERLGSGRNAVREAIAMLAALGVVESRPQSGIYLRELRPQSSFEALVMLSRLGREPTSSEVSETLEVRAALERTAMELACARRDDEDLATLDRILEETEAILDEKGNITEADNAFHLALVSATHNAILMRVLNPFYEFTLARRRHFFARRQRAKTSHRDHKQIVAAVRTRDAARAIKLIHAHLERTRSYCPAPAPRPGDHDRRLPPPSPQPVGKLEAGDVLRHYTDVLSAHTVLVVDDDPLVLDVVARILAVPGCTVLTARNGYEAAQTLADRNVDLMITDLKMPGLDGVELGIQAKRMRPHLHIIYITGFSDIAKRAQHGRVLQKPVRLADLLETVKDEMLAA